MQIQFTKTDRALDAINLAVAGLRDGVGPLLTVFLIQLGTLNPQKLSWVLAMPAIAGLWIYIPVGRLYDRVREKKYLLMAGAGLTATSALFISGEPSFAWLIVLQGLAGLAACMLNVGIPAISLQVAKVDGLGLRFARNEVFSKIGNFGALALSGFISHHFGIHWIFGVVTAFSVLVILASSTLPAAKREASALGTPNARPGGIKEVFDWRECFRNAPFLRIVIVCFLLQLTNAPLFMIFEQGYVPLHAKTGAAHISMALILSQVIIFGGSLWFAARTITSNAFSYFAVGFLLIALRGFVFANGFNDVTLAFGQLLDGLIASIVILVPMRTVAALDPLHFNLRLGTVGTVVGLGAALSMVSAGYLIDWLGHAHAPLLFSAVALVGLILAIWFMRVQKTPPVTELPPVLAPAV